MGLQHPPPPLVIRNRTTTSVLPLVPSYLSSQKAHIRHYHYRPHDGSRRLDLGYQLLQSLIGGDVENPSLRIVYLTGVGMRVAAGRLCGKLFSGSDCMRSGAPVFQPPSSSNAGDFKGGRG